jgi:hypothetical protein
MESHPMTIGGRLSTSCNAVVDRTFEVTDAAATRSPTAKAPFIETLDTINSSFDEPTCQCIGDFLPE